MPEDEIAVPVEIDKIPTDKELDENEQAVVKEALRGKIFPQLTPAKNDYVDEKKRGTVHFNPAIGNVFDPQTLLIKNYSYHSVIIPDGTTIEEVNFAQAEPHTPAIEGKNLTFIGCNLVNVEIDPSWTLIQTLNCHVRYSEVTENGRTYRVQEIEQDGVWVENMRTDISPLLPGQGGG